MPARITDMGRKGDLNIRFDWIPERDNPGETEPALILWRRTHSQHRESRLPLSQAWGWLEDAIAVYIACRITENLYPVPTKQDYFRVREAIDDWISDLTQMPEKFGMNREELENRLDEMGFELRADGERVH